MSALLPTPFFSLVLLLVWLLINNSLAFGQILLGAVLAVGLPLLLRPMHVPGPRVRSLHGVSIYLLRLLRDIVVANFDVAKLVLSSRSKLRPGFIMYPLDLTDDLPITLLASTISLTPGTVSADLTDDKRYLLIHVLDMHDEASLIEELKQRYERPLQEIFAC